MGKRELWGALKSGGTKSSPSAKRCLGHPKIIGGRDFKISGVVGACGVPQILMVETLRGVKVGFWGVPEQILGCPPPRSTSPRSGGSPSSTPTPSRRWWPRNASSPTAAGSNTSRPGAPSIAGEPCTPEPPENPPKNPRGPPPKSAGNPPPKSAGNPEDGEEPGWVLGRGLGGIKEFLSPRCGGTV